uniref:Pentapeptide repeat-containing protein n=1 Tax=Candidatus Kentrum sp. UNK TaxID=2126344 RepID=A0A451B421_9GAMM|nr:MAG: Pentapeptide repeat-containing protein [Candidatus Kentron sp. UNK]VFK73034.1 MAG: Pentapeptide repeat-containing protein [Candidatus Kentron sp. UNK]
MPRRFHPIQFLPTLLSLIKRPLWWFYHFSGLRHIWEMAAARRPNEFHYEKSPTLVLWIIGLYVALYGIASTRYEMALDRVENRMSALASQLSTGNDEAFKNLIARIPHVQRMETPLEPELLWPFRGHPFRAYFASCEVANEYLDSRSEESKEKKYLRKYFIVQSMGCERRNPEILAWTRETIETWSRKSKKEGIGKKEKKGKLAGVDLTGVDLSEANLEDADLSEAKLWDADLSEANLRNATILKAGFQNANLSKADFDGADLSGARLQKANLSGTNFSTATLSDARLKTANLSRADLSKADLSKADLSSADLEDIENWREIESINNANIFGVKSAPEGFKAWARDRGAVEMTPEGWRAFQENNYEEPEKWDLAR